MPKMSTAQKKHSAPDDGVQKISLRGHLYALVPWSDYARLARATDEDAVLIAAGDAARGDDSFPSDVARRLVSGEHPLKVIREWRGLSQAELGEKSGVGAQYVSQLERRYGGRNVGRKAASKLAPVLKVSPESLMDI